MKEEVLSLCVSNEGVAQGRHQGERCLNWVSQIAGYGWWVKVLEDYQLEKVLLGWLS